MTLPQPVSRSHSESDTMNLARELAGTVGGGTVILLFGELSAGKTAFVRGLVDGLDGDPGQVSSPTFTLIQPYRARLTVQHVDLYRLEPRDVEDLGLDELATDESIVVVEWAERMPMLPPQAVYVRIEDAGGDERSIEIEWPA
jgi:tRNA threonylcarbamoyladenosine biosynthesis protein TsaE